MEENDLIYQIKDLEKNIVMFITKDNLKCNNFPKPTTTQIRIVDYILKHDKNNIYQKDLEKKLNLTRATLSGVLKTMEKNGIINKDINDKDGRSKKIILSDKIIDKFKEEQQKINELKDILTKDLTKEELQAFNNVITKMKNNIIKYHKERND